MRILFFGSPEFSVPSLEKLTESRHEIAGVVTRGDKPKGRGRKLKGTAVKEFAVQNNLPLYQVDNLKEPNFLQKLNEFRADIFIVVGFPILPRHVIDMPEKGAVNLHASLLPAYRGAAPIQWAILNGEKETGVTTFFLNERVDTGEIILQQKVEIGESETAGELHDKLSLIGSGLLLETVNLIENGDFETFLQTGRVTKAPKITPDIPEINWDEDAQKTVNRIRAFSPFPGAFSFMDGKRVKFYLSSVINDDNEEKPGIVTAIDKDGLSIACGKGSVLIREIQIQGKRRMAVSEFLRGHSINPGTAFRNSRDNGG
ncbi:methionyl-tRNA formyltransferase [bacterium]|nr:methionyl-tRNA formyltransferase [bacterium]